MDDQQNSGEHRTIRGLRYEQPEGSTRCHMDGIPDLKRAGPITGTRSRYEKLRTW